MIARTTNAMARTSPKARARSGFGAISPLLARQINVAVAAAHGVSPNESIGGPLSISNPGSETAVRGTSAASRVPARELFSPICQHEMFLLFAFLS